MEDDNRILEQLAALRADTLAIALRELAAEVRASQEAISRQHTDNARSVEDIRRTLAEIRLDNGQGSIQGKLADAFISSDWKGRAAFMALPALCFILMAAWVSGERLTDLLQAGAALVHGPSTQESTNATP